ncbi:MAG: ferrous iron transport protein B [Treponema sp.]|uniref:ferrous iron transport protein B n=1 Tax=Treponema sp. TaxID=166 RepID=UPI0025FE73F3|nr:ferrous iron transport protein B [Treponema sp.]MBR0496539.1 ferrous iron transport protein B [Treponema sp.]
MNLSQVKIGDSVCVKKLGGNGALRQHFLDMGIIPGAEITLVKYAPLGDPMEFQLHGYELTLRVADAEKIEVTALGIVGPDAEGGRSEESGANEGMEREDAEARKARPADRQGTPELIDDITIGSHPGLGEGGKFHNKKEENPLPDGTVLSFALVGNQNCGKTTLFNKLTGSNQHVGNFPGVTVDRKSGEIKGHPDTLITDLPGIYSMSPYTSEELISRDFVLQEKPHAIINIVDATNIERNLYLTMQLLELNIPLVIALNMMDELTANGGSIDVNKMEHVLGVPVVPISAKKGQGIEELISHAVHVAKFQEKPLRQDFCGKEDNGGAVHRALHGTIHLIEDHAEKAGVPVRFAATKLLEDDKRILHKLDLDVNEKEMLEHIIMQMEKERGLDRSASIADMRFSFIYRLCDLCVKKPHESRERARSEKIDRVLTGRWSAIPCFFAIMAGVFYLTFNVIGAWLQGLLEAGIDGLTVVCDSGLSAIGVNEVLHGLIIDGIFAGVGSVLSFLPIIVTLFFFLSMLEDSGYIARVAFFMDKLLRKIGLSGRSIVPLLIGFGCSVPAVMSTRTLPSERDRKMTILLTPFMSCTAKLPIYAFFVNAFFPSRGGLIMTGLYFLGIFVGILVALIYKRTIFKGEAVPFVMELPNYRMPGLRNTVQLLWEKAKDFLQRAFTVIFIATIVVWFLQSFNWKMQLVDDAELSILASIARLISPLMKPIGLGDWQISVALVSGFIAKESVVSTLEILFADGVQTILSSASAASLLVFSLLYTPCVAAIASIKRELGAKWAAGLVIWQCALAWICAFICGLACSL